MSEERPLRRLECFRCGGSGADPVRLPSVDPKEWWASSIQPCGLCAGRGELPEVAASLERLGSVLRRVGVSAAAAGTGFSLLGRAMAEALAAEQQLVSQLMAATWVEPKLGYRVVVKRSRSGRPKVRWKRLPRSLPEPWKRSRS